MFSCLGILQNLLAGLQNSHSIRRALLLVSSAGKFVLSVVQNVYCICILYLSSALKSFANWSDSIPDFENCRIFISCCFATHADPCQFFGGPTKSLWKLWGFCRTEPEFGLIFLILNMVIKGGDFHGDWTNDIQLKWAKSLLGMQVSIEVLLDQCITSYLSRTKNWIIGRWGLKLPVAL